MQLYLIIAGAAVLGLFVGLISARWPPLRVIATVLALGSYAATVAGVWIWAAQCWDCVVGTQNDRAFALVASAWFYGLTVLAAVAGIWTAPRVVGLLRRPEARR